MKKCEYCGKDIGADASWKRDICDGVQTLGTDPFAEEIQEDYTEYWMCMGQREDSAMEI